MFLDNPEDGRIAFFGADQRDFSDTAALLDLMDLVVTIDTSVAHLAGAMGKPAGYCCPTIPIGDGSWIATIVPGTRLLQDYLGSSNSETGRRSLIR